MKKKSVLCLAVVAALAAGALWYTRSVSIAQAVRADRATAVDATLVLNEPYQKGTATYYSTNRIDLDAESGTPAMDAVLAVLEAHSCRASLYNLIPHYGGSLYESPENNLNLSLFIDGKRLDLITSDLRDNLTVFNLDHYTDTFSVGKEFYEELSAVVRKYGVPYAK